MCSYICYSHIQVYTIDVFDNSMYYNKPIAFTDDLIYNKMLYYL